MSVTEPVYISYLNYIGSGAPADGDQITRDNSTYPLNCVYTDRDSGITYVRKATTKVAATDWQAGGGGATEVTVYQLPTTLTDAQIKALGSSPVELVPPPGAGKAIVFQSAIFNRPAWVAPYTITTYDSMKIVYTGGTGGVDQGFYNDPEGSAEELKWLMSEFTTTSQVYFDLAVVISNVSYGSKPNMVGTILMENKGLNLAAFLMDADWTGGDSTNTLSVTVFYSIVDL